MGAGHVRRRVEEAPGDSLVGIVAIHDQAHDAARVQAEVRYDRNPFLLTSGGHNVGIVSEPGRNGSQKSSLLKALQADGWWLRSALPWVKRSAMPSSVIDRPSTAKLDPATNEWVLNGTKIFVTSGVYSEAVVVWASLDRSKGRPAIKSFVASNRKQALTHLVYKAYPWDWSSMYP